MELNEITMDAHQQSVTGLPSKYTDQTHRHSEFDGADEGSFENLILSTPMPSPSHLGCGFAEENTYLIEREARQSDGHVGENIPTDIVMSDRAASSTESTACVCFHKCTFSNVFSDFVLPVFSIITYIFDVGSDIWLAVQYAQAGHWWWCGWTLTFVVVAAFGMALMTLYYDQYHYCSDELDDPLHINNPVLRWFVTIIAAFSLILPIKHYIRLLMFGIKTYTHPEDYTFDVVHWGATASIVRLLEVCMEAGPQLMLQLYIMMRVPRGNTRVQDGHALVVTHMMTTTGFANEVNEDYAVMIPHVMTTATLSTKELLQITSVVTSLVSITWAIVSFPRCSRLEKDIGTSIPRLIMETLWHLFVIGARVLAVVVFALEFKLWLLAAVGIHCVVIIMLIMKYKITNLTQIGNSLFGALAVISTNVLCVFLYYTESGTRLRYVTLHCIMYTENVVMAVLWYTASQTQELWYRIPCMVIILLGYIIGVIFQSISYMMCHHNSNHIKCCVSYHELEFEETESYGFHTRSNMIHE